VALMVCIAFWMTGGRFNAMIWAGKSATHHIPVVDRDAARLAISVFIGQQQGIEKIQLIGCQEVPVIKGNVQPQWIRFPN
jgi:hypothetical protein